ncbi:MAG: choice-of-anchor B family protein [Rhodothermaceae bacterium]|nr:choice-of-anchor B family protein [Rhodothermaceae bacterium]
MTFRPCFFYVLLLSLFVTATSVKAQYPPDNKGASVQKENVAQHSPSAAPVPSILGQKQTCENGVAERYPCQDIDLLAFVSLSNIASGVPVFIRNTNDIWGWTDPETGTEYALVGTSGGTAFYDLTDPTNPEKIAFLVTETNQSLWRDIKVYNNHAFIVSDLNGNHGMQVYDLTQLRTIENPPDVVKASTLYTSIGSAHNVAINEETGYAYIVGANSSGVTCGGGLHMVNIQDPMNPTFERCFINPGRSYTHDVQCVTYKGPDTDYSGREICLASNELILSIADVTDKANPVKISAVGYPGSSYTHQGWLSEDHRYFFMDDEFDEFRMLVPQTRTLIWDLEDLDDPVLASEYLAQTPTSDHNQYVRGNYLIQSNYESGVRILDISSPETPIEIAYFDLFPESDDLGFSDGTWSNYPYFASGILIATSMNDGLFVLEPTSITFPVANGTPQQTLVAEAFMYPNPLSHHGLISVTFARSEQVEIEVYDLLGRHVQSVFSGVVQAGTNQEIPFERKGLPAGLYHLRLVGETFSETLPITVVGN